MRRPLMVLLSLGVVFGFGSGFASVARHLHGGGGCHAGSHGQWGERWGDRDWRGSDELRRSEAPPAPPQAQPQAPAQAQPQIYFITPQAQAPAPVVVTQGAAQPQLQPIVVVPAAAPTPAPAVVTPQVAPTPKAP
jgi:hypothetical protein